MIVSYSIICLFFKETGYWMVIIDVMMIIRCNWRKPWSSTRVKTHKLLQVCKQVVTSLLTSCVRTACS